MLVFPIVKFFHPSLVKNHKHFHSLKLLKKFGVSKEFQLHSHKNSDIIKTIWGYSPIHMTFYSTKNSCNFERKCCIKEKKFKRDQIVSIFDQNFQPLICKIILLNWYYLEIMLCWVSIPPTQHNIIYS